MTMNLRQFKENVLLYGADLRSWPEDLREAGQKALASSSEAQTVMAQEEHFEAVLGSRKFEEPSGDLAERIGLACRRGRKKSRSRIGGFLSDLLWEFSLPRSALTAVSVALIFALVIGFAIGFSNPTGTTSTEQYQANLQDFLYDEGEVL
jgi:hypothetical protein